ncbi:family 16 glycosylhydrolase [Pseudoalteromonas sp. SWYJZ12]|uniref:family 16 glycosylhydrolase n=1 Tax=Pseudoalteromonas sp. SWYJZ12 TaxID=2792067 RepID=UPI0018CE1A1C|nr:family 16 glycosylhydrolase [Pseudoalteromonas sp. SWYJZ12]MBH0002346.1 family 16 glycosylhydrolase [Pseudoalteromonas sp. SWYJZ12]
MFKVFSKCTLATIVVTSFFAGADQPRELDSSTWQLQWNDEFNYANAELDKNWVSQNGPTENPWVLSSRWRDNAQVKNGILHLLAKKEPRGGQDWTTGNIWSKRSFHYGYFEARFKYAGAYGTNNSFWFWPKQGVKDGLKACEIDINEGHFPNIINTNVHNWTDTYTLPNGRVTHSDNQLHHTLIGKPDHTVEFNKPVKTKKIRLTSTNPTSLHISEFRVFAPSAQYPDAFDEEKIKNISNLAQADDVSIKTNGLFNKLISEESFAIDGNPQTRWVSEKHGEKFLELSWDKSHEIGAIQFINGWLQEHGVDKGAYRNLISDYNIEYHDGENWQKITSYNAADVADFSKEFHTYGLEWDKDYFNFYFDGELYYTMRNDVCFSETTMLFSLAILKAAIAGPVSDDIAGTSMAIDWVRYYTRKENSED